MLRKVGTKLRGRQREIADRVDQLEAGIGQDLAESAGLVAKQVGTDQNSGHGQLGESVVIIAGNRERWRRPATVFFIDPTPPRLASANAPTYSHRTLSATGKCRRVVAEDDREPSAISRSRGT